MSNNLPKALFTNYIPTGIINGNHIKIDKEVAEDFLNKKSSRSDTKTPSSDSIKVMAKINPEIAKMIDKDENIKGIRESSNSSTEDILEYNKSRNIKNANMMSGRISRAHMVEDSFVQSNKTAKDIVVDKNCMINRRVDNNDSRISNISREIIKSDKRNKFNSSQAKKEQRDSMSVVHGSDRDPITNISKGIKNTSDRQVFSKFQRIEDIKPITKISIDEINSRSEIISEAYKLLAERNQVKINGFSDFDDNCQTDSLNKLNKKILDSHRKTSERIDLMQKEANLKIDPKEASILLKEYIGKKKTEENSIENIKEFNKNRSESIKKISNIKSTIDEPALPMRSSSKQSIANKLVDSLSLETLNKFKKSR